MTRLTELITDKAEFQSIASEVLNRRYLLQQLL